MNACFSKYFNQYFVNRKFKNRLNTLNLPWFNTDENIFNAFFNYFLVPMLEKCVSLKYVQCSFEMYLQRFQ